MDTKKALDGLAQSSFDLALLNHEDKSNEELRNIIQTNRQLIAAIPFNPNNAQLIEAQKKLGELKACIKIIEDREKKDKDIQKALEDWEKNLPKRRKDAVMNLPFAVSFEGQLIAAVLEDEGPKTAEELANWDETLSKIDSTKFTELLSGLVKEEIITCDSNGVYSLLNICTESLFPTSPIDWATKKLSQKNETLGLKSIDIIAAMQSKGAPLFDSEIVDISTSDPELKAIFKRNPERNAEVDIKQLLNNNIIEKHSIKSEKYFICYFTMLGEKRKEK